MNKILISVLLVFMSPFNAFSKDQKATFAGGCFWCMESPFEKLKGVKSVISGFMGGDLKNPEYKQVSGGGTGHLEVIQIIFDDDKVSYEDLLQVFWRNVDPTDSGGQFVDRGGQYATAIFYHSKEQKEKAEQSKKIMNQSKRFKSPIVTPVREASVFYPAEEYHQDFYKKNKIKYRYYRYRSGRDQFIDKTWGKERNYSPQDEKTSDLKLQRETKENQKVEKPEKKETSEENKTNSSKTGEKKKRTYTKPGKKEIKSKLTAIQYKVTQEEGTEPPFQNEYWDNKREGIYVDIVSGEPLFSSTHKYRSGTGWPSFYKPLVSENIVEKKDSKLFLVRTEVRSKYGDSHLGHIFKDGPKPTGLRYCINSAALRFIPKKELKDQGYPEYLRLFE